MKKSLLLIAIAGTLLCVGAWGWAMPANFPDFSTKTLDGKIITNALFSEKKLTMVNIWTTWCPPCINEMPDLGNMGRAMPEGTQLIGIILDVKGSNDSKTIDAAKKILSWAEADFIQILPSKEMEFILGGVDAIPTTIFVDFKSQIVGQPLVGARDEKAYRTEIDKLLKSMP